MKIFKDVVGGLLGVDLGRSDREDRANAQFDANQAMQREFAQMGVRWRVEDAKAAGLHPLAALGVQPAQSQPMQVMSEGPARGSTLGETAQALALIRGAGAAAEKDTAMAAYYRALEKRILDAAKGQAPFPTMGSPGQLPGNLGVASAEGTGAFTTQEWETVALADGSRAHMANPLEGRVEHKPSVVSSAHPGDPSREAGEGPGWKVYRIGPGMNMWVPGSNSMSEALESMSESKVVLGWVIAKNVEQYGASWLVKFMKQYGSLFSF